MTAVLDAPPQHQVCAVDHDQLQPRVAVIPGQRHGATLSYWSCPACPYYFTAITAAPKKKATMANVTTLDKLTVVKALARPTALGLVIAANPHLTKLQVETIAADHGHPRINDLRQAMLTLQRQAGKERMQAAVHTGPTEAGVASARTDRVEHIANTPARTLTAPSSPPAAPASSEPIVGLLAAGKRSQSKRIVNLAVKIEQQLDDLHDRLHAETQARRDAERAEKERAEAIAEVAQAEEALRAAREKARKFKNHPGGNGRARTTQSPSSDSRRAGGNASRPHLANHRDTGRQYQYDLVERLGCTIADIRAWANDQGLNPGGGSRIARTILDAYEAAHPAQAAS